MTGMRRFVVWAEVRYSKHEVELPETASDEECEAACRYALDTLIGNGDTGWNELDDDGGPVQDRGAMRSVAE